MNASPTEFWTIGHSTRSIDEFIGLLQQNNINTVVDVRQFSGSRRYPQFGKAALAAALAAVGIKYFHLPELGGRRKTSPNSPNTAWRNAAFRGYADYMMTREFRAGMERLEQIAKNSRTAILCAEALSLVAVSSLIDSRRLESAGPSHLAHFEHRQSRATSVHFRRKNRGRTA